MSNSKEKETKVNSFEEHSDMSRKSRNQLFDGIVFFKSSTSNVEQQEIPNSLKSYAVERKK